MKPQFDHKQIERYLQEAMLPIEVQILEQRLEGDPVLLAELRSYARIHGLALPERWRMERATGAEHESEFGKGVEEPVGHFRKMPNAASDVRNRLFRKYFWSVLVLLIVVAICIWACG